MFFPTIFSFAILLATAAADLHASCVCNNAGTYSADLTAAACKNYDDHRYSWGRSSFDSASGRCAGASGGQLAGNQWESSCQAVGKQDGINSGIRGDC